MATATLYHYISWIIIIYRLFPDLKWAQRKDRLFITVELADFEGHKIDLTPEGKLSFS